MSRPALSPPSSAAASRPSSSSSSAAGMRSGSAHRKVAHTSVQHARFLEPLAPPRTETLSEPFSVYLAKLARLERAHQAAAPPGEGLAPHHLVVDCVRILEDVLVHAAQTFLTHRTPPTLLALSVEHAQTSVAERLRDAEVISPWINRQIEDARKLARWVLASSAREVPQETASNCLVLVTRLARQFLSHVQRAAEAKPASGCTARHAFCRDMTPEHLDVVGGPHNAHTLPSNTRPGTAAIGSPQGGDIASPNAGGLTSPNGSSAAPPAGGLANPNAKSLKPQPRAHAALPYGWDVATFEAHCAPLHNTSHLDLQAIEAEEEAAEAEELATKEAERAEKVRLREEAAQRRRVRRAAEESRRAAKLAEGGGPDSELSDLDENPEEVDSEEERLTARRKSAREAAGEGAAAVAEQDEEEEEEDEDDEDGSKAAARAERAAAAAAQAAAIAADESLANEVIPSRVVPSKTRFLFSFCCIVCHSVLLRGRDVDRIANNQVWSKAGKNLAGANKSLLKNFADTWSSRAADEREKPAGAAAGEEEEEEEAPPAAGEEEEESLVSFDAPPKDEGAPRRDENTIGVHCAGCDMYVGRYFPSKDSYRLIYIQRSSGQNFMYFTGDAAVARLRPLMVRKSEEAEEAKAEARAKEEEQGSDEEDDAFAARLAALEVSRNSAPVPQVVGLPFEYQDERQAPLYPFPRFGPCTPYNQPGSFALFQSSLTTPATTARADASALSGSKPLGSTTGLLSPTATAGRAPKGAPKCNSKTYRPPVPPVPLVHSMLRRAPDSHYALPSAEEVSLDPSRGQAITADLSVLLWTDRVFHNRRAMDQVSARVTNLFATFPSGVYTNVLTPPVPVYTHFFLPGGADFTMCRGTARYVFHFLTQRDDAKVKRVQYTYKKLLRALARHENLVIHLSAGGHGGHRFVLVKVGLAFRIFQSNHNLHHARDRFTCNQWIASDYPWSRILDVSELYAFLAKFEEARRGRKQIWEELFTCGQKALALHDVSDQWQPEQVFFACAKLQDFAIQM